MRFFIPIVAFICFFSLLDYGLLSSIAIAMWVFYVTSFFMNINNHISFREYVLVMYGLNYLFSAALQYHMASQQYSIYRMRIPEDEYFALAIPAMLAFHAGLYSIKTKIFTPNFNLGSLATSVNETVLKQWMIGGIFLNLGAGFLPGEIAFLVYLVGGIRYIGAFGLFIIDKKKYKWYLIGIVLVEIVNSLRMGMFHDMIIWVLFFGMVWTYLKKPNFFFKAILSIIAISCFYTLQITKSSYREQLRNGESGFGSFSQAVSKNAESEAMLSDGNISTTLTRANQGWIFSAAVRTMNIRGDYQGSNLIKKYIEAAILPRVLAPDKLEAGDKEIFTRYSGVKLGKGTSMGLGILADGYISYGNYGVFIFAFVLGLLFALGFKFLQKWSAISPYFVLLMFVIFNFAVRADCETQTLLGHLIKGVLVFSLMMSFYKKYFAKQLLRGANQGQEENIEFLPGQVAI